MIDDAELLRRYAEEKFEAAFAELVQRHLDLVYSAALRRLGGDAHAAADVAQQVFTALARQAASLTCGAMLPRWLYTTTRNVAVDFIRAEQRRRAREQEAHIMHELTSTPSSAGAWEQTRPVLDEAMDELSGADREIVVLRFFARRPFADIGESFNLSEDAARMRVDRALEKLHALLARRGVTSMASALGLVLEAHARVSAPVGLLGSVTSKAIASSTATAGTVTVAETLGFMSTMKLAGGLAAALLLIAAIGTGAYTVWARGAAENALLAERGSYDALEVEVLAAKTRALALEKGASELKRSVDAARAARAASEAALATNVTEAKAAFDPDAAGDAFMAKHPAVKEALGDYARARVNYRFTELYKKLGFSPAQIARFQELAARAGMGSDTVDGEEMQLHWPREISNDQGRELFELLGKEGMSLYGELNDKDESRTMAAHVAGSLWFSDAPLSPAQAERLTEVFQGSRAKSRGKNYARIDWDAAIARAREFLSAPQLAVLEGEKAHDQLNAALNRPMSTAAATSSK